MKKIYLFFVAAFATICATAQTYNGGKWYSFYQTESFELFTIAEHAVEPVFAPTAKTFSFEYKYRIWGMGIGGIAKVNNTYVYESADGGENKTQVGDVLTSKETSYQSVSTTVSENINYIFFDRPMGNTNYVDVQKLSIPLKYHILFDSGDYGSAKALSNNFGELVWGEASEAYSVKLRSFYTTGNITISSDIPEVFRINSSDNTAGLTYEVGANACASKNGAKSAKASGATLGQISNYNFNIYFCPQEAKDYEGTVTITDGTSTLTINVSGKGLKKDQAITWDINDAYKTTDVLPVAAANSNLQVAYTFAPEGIVAYNELSNTLEVIKDGEVKITASQAGNDNKYKAAADVVKTLTISKVPTEIIAVVASDILSGSKLSASVLSDGQVKDNIAGTFAWLKPDTILASGTHDDLVAVFTPDNTNWYTTAEKTTSVKVVPSYGTFAATVCSDSKYTYVDGNEYAEGEHQVTITNYLGGDSIVTLTITKLPVYTTTDETTICANELPYTWEGENFTEAGVITKTLTSSVGCDSTVTFTLNVLPTYNVNDEATICASELPYSWEGETFTEAGAKTLTLKTINNCDSVVTFTLNVLPVSPDTEREETITAGEWVEMHGDQIVLDVVGDTLLVDSLLNINGCDSVILFTVHVLEPVVSNINNARSNSDQVQKFFRNGRMYILRGKELYDIIGRKQE